MSGLLSGVLPAVFSAGNKLKRQIGGLLSDPVGTVQQQVGLLNDKAGAFNQLTAQAAQEHVNSLKTGGGMGQAQMKLANTLADSYNPIGMVVWHGSPHKFSKFDSSKIGTGEGAQAYGHGLYLAESPDVAKSYQTALSADRGFSFGGKDGLTRAEVQDLVNAKYGGGYLDGVIRPSGVADSFIDDMVTGTLRPDGAMPRQYKPGSDRARVYNELRGQITHTDPGSLYKVDLPDDAIAKMLDWDKPLSQQSDAVQSFINMAKASPEKAGFSAVPRSDGMVDIVAPTGEVLGRESAEMAQEAMRIYVDGFMSNAKTGADLVKRFASPGTLNNQKVMQNPMQAAGIPGIRYLDGGSRGAGSGTSNFVVFPGNEGLLTILERNGQPIK